MLGAFAGSVLGDAVGGDVGQIVGTSAGVMAGTAAGAQHGQINFVLAVSPTKVHVLRPDAMLAITRERLALVHTFDRAHLEVTVKGRVTVRTLILTDTETGDEIELEGSRVPWSHAKQTIRAFASHGEDADEPEAAAAAPA
jgi:hypothetical protein